MLAAGLLLVCGTGYAADLSFPGGSVHFTDAGHQALSGPVKIVLFLTALSFLPAVLVSVTSFTRIIIVLAMLRQGIGMNSTPPNSVLISLAMFLTIFTMSPVIDQINQAAVTPYLNGQLGEREAVDAGSKPLKQFLVKQTRDKDIALIRKLSHKDLPKTLDEVGIFELIPAFMLSELRTAFEIGFVVFLPFILIDLVVASVLMSLGMIMVPPLAISLPLKVLMFVLIDGWSLLVESLVRSFHG
jgi:flagellar biosynthetic protein FliP